MGQGGADVLVIGGVVLPLDGIDRDAVVDDQRGGHVVLSRERVRGAEDEIGSAVRERARQVRGLAGDMETG